VASLTQDDSKKFKYEQMVAIREVVVTGPQLSAAMLHKNMQMHYSPTKTSQEEHMLSFYRASKMMYAQQIKDI
jgi:hypothetical protein